MGKAVWLVEQLPETFEDAHGESVKIYSVRHVHQPVWESTHVWYDDDNGARCCGCSGILTAMRSDCPHATAVKRHVDKERTNVKLERAKTEARRMSKEDGMNRLWVVLDESEPGNGGYAALPEHLMDLEQWKGRRVLAVFQGGMLMREA